MDLIADAPDAVATVLEGPVPFGAEDPYPTLASRIRYEPPRQFHRQLRMDWRIERRFKHVAV